MEDKKNSVGIIGKLLGKKSEPEFSAERAWIESTYGVGSYKEIDVRIKNKQDYIKACIETKFKQIYPNGNQGYSTYHCIIDIEEDLASHVDTIFEPFLKKNFVIINLSEKIEEINEPHVYLFSWKNAFKKLQNIENTEVKLIEE